jgi:hypothetical protein
MTFPDWLSWVADAASVVGLAITIAVWLQTKALKMTFVLRARLPEFSSALKSASDRIFDSPQNSSADLQRSEAELARLSAILRNLSLKLMPPERKSAMRLLKKCDQSERKHPFLKAAEQRQLAIDRLWEIYNGTQELIESLKQAEQDFKWS